MMAIMLFAAVRSLSPRSDCRIDPGPRAQRPGDLPADAPSAARRWDVCGVAGTLSPSTAQVYRIVSVLLYGLLSI